MKKIYLASDHAGYELKDALTPFLRERGFEVEDLGPHTFDPSDDYPDYMFALASAVVARPGSFGVAIGGSGQGEAMALNRVKGARATVFYGGNTDILKISREHNGANILSLGARFVEAEEAKSAVILWLSTPFTSEERHVRRIKKIDV